MDNKDFFVVDLEECGKKILYHVPSSKIFAFSKDKFIKNLTDDNLYNVFPELKRHSKKLAKKCYGKGMINITFMSARTCNMKCKYCYAGEGEYGGNKIEYFSYDLYIKSIKKVLKMYPEGIKGIGFYGGEALLNFKVIKKFIPDCVEYFKKNNLKIPDLAISTNAILLDNEIVEFCKNYNIKIGLSIDGPKHINDIFRINKEEKGSNYDDMANKVALLRKQGIKYAFQLTINKEHIRKYRPGIVHEWLDSMELLRYANTAIVPVVTDDKNIKISTNDFEALKFIAKEVFEYYLNNMLKTDTNMFATGILASLNKIAKNKIMDNCSAGYSIFIDTDANIYPCHMFCNDDKAVLGNVLNDDINLNNIDFYSNVSRFDSSTCKVCIARNVCLYWCKGIQKLYNDDLYSVHSVRCIFFIEIVKECLKTLVKVKQNKSFYNHFWDSFAKINNHPAIK